MDHNFPFGACSAHYCLRQVIDVIVNILQVVIIAGTGVPVGFAPGTATGTGMGMRIGTRTHTHTCGCTRPV
jgi:hypothetical protein